MVGVRVAIARRPEARAGAGAESGRRAEAAAAAAARACARGVVVRSSVQAGEREWCENMRETP